MLNKLIELLRNFLENNFFRLKFLKPVVPFHLVKKSPWPIILSIGGLGLVCGLLMLFYAHKTILLKSSFFLLGVSLYFWWEDIIHESKEGFHTEVVQIGLKLGIALFIISEVIFFFRFFWAFFHRRVSPSIELGSAWPPEGIQSLEPFKIPLLNTIILLSSGVSVTWCHHRLIGLNKTPKVKYFKTEWVNAREKKIAVAYNETVLSLLYTIVAGIYFVLIQLIEYLDSSFTIRDRVFGRTFFLATGFHGFHVIVGTFFLLVILGRLEQGHFTATRHIGLEIAVWYWHFVDVVWLFLYLFLYWWRGK